MRSTGCARPSAGRPTISTRPGIGASSLTLGGLLKHLAAAEDYMFTTKLSGEPIGPPWDAFGWDGSNDWEFTFAANEPPEQLYALWDGAVERSRGRLDAALADGGLDQLVHVSWPDGRHASPRRLVCDLIEGYGRHGPEQPAVAPPTPRPAVPILTELAQAENQ